MTKKIFFFLFCCSWLFSCSDKQVDSEFKNSYISSDKDLIQEWIFTDYNPNMNPEIVIDIKDYTTTEIFDKIGGRVYTVICDVPGLENRCVFVKDSSVYDLGRYNLMGASEPENMLVANLDNDANNELYFTITQGSGILKTNIACYINGLNDKYIAVDANFFFPFHYSIQLKKGSGYLDVIYKSDSEQLSIGKLTMIEMEGEPEFIFTLNDNLPQHILDDINDSTAD